MSDTAKRERMVRELVERAARNQTVFLRDENAALRAAVERVRALHVGRVVSSGLRRVCWECGAPFPCPTLRALEETP